MLLTGCRRGEALGARWDQFDWPAPRSSLSHNESPRVCWSDTYLRTSGG